MSIPIRELIQSIYAGQVRIPAFQREFVWDSDRVAQFVDSLYKQYPFGSLLFWRSNEQLDHERDIGPYALPERDAEYPIDYVLDGQQRVTSIFACFQTELPRPDQTDWVDVYFDFVADPDPQDSAVFALQAGDADPGRFFPVKVLFDSVEYRAACESVPPQFIPKVDEFQARIKETLLPVQILRTNDRATVANVFERINHQGVPLDTLQLLTAWTWSGDFDLRRRFEDLRDALDEHGFADVGEDTSLILRCCSAIITGSPRTSRLMELNGSLVREKFERVENGIRGAVDFLKHQIGIEALRNLPYPAMLIPLSVYFSTDGQELLIAPEEHIRQITRWFWRSCFSERYSGQTVKVSEQDTGEALKLRAGEVSTLGDSSVNVPPEFFLNNQFRMNTAKTATFILLLAFQSPRSFISGNKISLKEVLQASNRREYHHMFPIAALKEFGIERPTNNCLANLCILDRADNNKIRSKRPSEYRALMPTGTVLTSILGSAVATEVLFEDDYAAFLEQRAGMLSGVANSLCG
jgi:hypothetical protein